MPRVTAAVEGSSPVGHVSRVSSLVGVILAGLAAGLGAVALVGWVAGVPLLASFGADKMPMAPIAAVLFLLFGAAIFLLGRGPQSPAARRTAAVLGLAGTGVSLILLVLASMGIRWSVERLGMRIAGSMAGIPIGHMSPVTAACFAMAGASFLALWWPAPARRWPAVAAFCPAAFVTLTSAVLLLACLYGPPILYGSGTIPPALTTSLAFLMLGGSLLLSSRSLAATGEGPSEARGHRPAYVFALIFVLLAAGIVTVGYLYFQRHERYYRAQAEKELLAVARLRVVQLVDWRQGRTGDAEMFFANPGFSALAARYLDDGQDPLAKEPLRVWLNKTVQHADCDRVILLDAANVGRMSVPDKAEPVDVPILRAAPDVLQSGKIRVLDLYLCERDGRVYMAVLVPLLAGPENRKVGVLALCIDPAKSLYPKLSAWPAPSPTAETLLVRRDGDDVLFLNELRFRKDTALKLHVPLKGERELAAAKAAMGQEGIVEGVDYRGVPVVAAVYSVPGSPWSLVAHKDKSEILAPVRERWWLTVTLCGVLLVAAGVAVGLVWWRQSVYFYRGRSLAADALRASEVQYRRLFEAAMEGILILDAQTGMVVDVNPFLVDLLGFSREQFLGKAVWELGFLKDVLANQEKFAQLQEKGYVRYEDLPLETADGQRINVEFVSNTYLVNRHKLIQCNIRDITERKRTASFREAIIERMGDGLCVCHEIPEPPYVAFTVWNARMTEITGYTLEQINRLGWYQAMYPDPELQARAAERMARMRDGDDLANEEWEVTCADGGKRTLAISTRTLQNTNDGVHMLAIMRDITERKRAETVLRERMAHIQLAMQVARMGFWQLDVPSGTITTLHGRGPVFGLPDDSTATTGAFLALVHPDDRAMVAEHLRLAIEAREPYQAAFRIVLPDGALRWVSACGHCSRDEAGRPLALIGVDLDITEWKQAEQRREETLRQGLGIRALQRSLLSPAPLDDTLKAITDGIVQIFDADFCRIWLIRPGDLCERDCLYAEVHDGVHRCGHRDRCLHLMASSGRYTHTDGKGHRRVPFGSYKIGRIASGEELKSLTNDVVNDPRIHDHEWAKELGLVSFAGYPLQVPGGQVMGVLALFAKHPISTGEDAMLNSLSSATAFVVQQAAAETALRDSEKRFRTLVASITDYTYRVIVRDGRVVETVHSPGCLAVTGYSPEEFQAEPDLWLHIVPPEVRPEVFDWVAKIVSGVKAGFLEHPIIHKNGQTRWVRSSAVLLHDRYGQCAGYEGLIQDVTEYRQLQDRFGQAQKMEAIGLLAGGVAHDFRNQLTVIKGFAEILLRRDMVTAEGREKVDYILKAADRSATISGQLLAFSRQELLRPEVVNVVSLTGEMMKSLAQTIGEDIKLSVVPCRDPWNIRLDAGLFQQTLLNLVLNARDAMPRGGRLTVGTENVVLDENLARRHGVSASRYVLLSVTDTGIGIAPEALEHIFDPFFTTKPVGQGTGLGLAMVHGFVSQSGGFIEARSRPGQGTTFRLYFPAVEDVAKSVAEKVSQAEGLPRGSGTILVVEDEKAVREILLETLGGCGYTVLTAGNAQEAIAVIESTRKIDLLVTDVVMPGWSGPELAKHFQAARPGVPVLLVSGHTGKALSGHGVIASDVNLLVKPFSSQSLVETVRTVLGQAQRP
ncbi:MAG: PAS domain S-box protein [Planctomycetota bacterium]|nr:PAS domain S-box protein [Planctomycetota bacterium]